MATTFMSDRSDSDLAIPAPARSVASIVAIIAAGLSFYFSGGGREFVGLFLAVLAIGAGMIGGLRALSPSVRGGILSILAVVLGVVAILFSIVALIF